MTPRLLSEEAAREYLGGVDPRKVCAPRRFGRAIRWDVEDLNAALDAGRVTAKPSESGGDDDDFNIMERLNRAAQRSA